ncbi:hypothetical protein AOX59_18965 [Lentibacillus amyloliquefaciens]|uniref:Uncharacterized protein n=2 Tax=Lentibacillus amyloliquefaciens TaxID=1472767 RepID=A0A0U4F5A1_9BACI|nr:hypothetical protein AOX59_00040 [Lentibacillus amyloliquefaciens]ALX50711.1 hypothetical protein AOX59_18965 [Lentibacillus amyloliquefaciens]
MTLAKNENGSVKENETEIAISQQPYIDGPADEKPIYRALGIDQEGNEYEVKWEVVDYWQALEDESEMCDWDSPAEVEAI